MNRLRLDRVSKGIAVLVVSDEKIILPDIRKPVLVSFSILANLDDEEVIFVINAIDIGIDSLPSSVFVEICHTCPASVFIEALIFYGPDALFSGMVFFKVYFTPDIIPNQFKIRVLSAPVFF
jgi:hypothetical protein